MEEYHKYTPDNDNTQLRYKANFLSSLSLFAKQVERFSVTQYNERGARARKGLQYVLDALKSEGYKWGQLRRDTSTQGYVL